MVMVIAHSDFTRTILRVILNREGLETSCFSDGPSALKALQASPEGGPDQVIADLIILERRLLGWDGYEVLLRLKRKSHLKAIPVIMVLPPNAGAVDRLKCRLAGAASFILKPFTIQNVISSVRTLLPVSIVPSPVQEASGCVVPPSSERREWE